MLKTLSSASLLLSALCLLSGCAAVGSDYTKPSAVETYVPSSWSATHDAIRAAHPAPPTAWWKALGDPQLESLVDAAFKASPSLEAATARLSAARASESQTYSYAFPTLSAQSSSSRSVMSADGMVQRTGSTLLATSWELDLVGGTRRGIEGATARVAAQEASLDDARVSLAADVVDAYVAYRSCQLTQLLNTDDLASRQATAVITNRSAEIGFTAPYQAARTEASVLDAASQLRATQAQCNKTANLLVKLTGLEQPAVLSILQAAPKVLPQPASFDIAVPETVLANRPDVRVAERTLAASLADVGVAQADRFPRLTLTGNMGYSISGPASKSVSFGSWSFGPSLTLPLFDGGRRAAAVEAARARYDEALANYKSKARTAVQEIEDALTRYAAAIDRTTVVEESAIRYEKYFKAVEARYREGASSLLELEDARRVMLTSKQSLLSLQQERLQSWVLLYRATGGAAHYHASQGDL